MNKANMNKVVNNEVAENTISIEVIDHIQKVLHKAQALNEYAGNKLAPILLESPMCSGNGGDTPIRMYPPYFEAIRIKLYDLESELDSINLKLDNVVF